MTVWFSMGAAIWLFLPCYNANMAPVAAARFWPTWNAPLDGGRLHKDGRPVLGNNKTWRGLTAGILAGAITSLALALLAPTPLLDFGRSHAGLGFAAAFGAWLGLCAILGDAAKSYLKRRVGRLPATPWFPFDQLDFVLACLLGALAVAPLAGGWVWDAYFGDWVTLAVIVVVSRLLQWFSSVLAYWGGIKEVPW